MPRGHEKELLLALTLKAAQNIDIVVEIGNLASAEAVYQHFKTNKIETYAQKIGWEKVTELLQMPTSHRDGSLSISQGKEMPW